MKILRWLRSLKSERYFRRQIASLKYNENSSLGLNLQNGALKAPPDFFVDSKEEFYVGFVPQKLATVPNGIIMMSISRLP